MSLSGVTSVERLAQQLTKGTHIRIASFSPCLRHQTQQTWKKATCQHLYLHLKLSYAFQSALNPPVLRHTRTTSFPAAPHRSTGSQDDRMPRKQDLCTGPLDWNRCPSHISCWCTAQSKSFCSSPVIPLGSYMFPGVTKVQCCWGIWGWTQHGSQGCRGEVSMTPGRAFFEEYRHNTTSFLGPVGFFSVFVCANHSGAQQWHFWAQMCAMALHVWF